MYITLDSDYEICITDNIFKSLSLVLQYLNSIQIWSFHLINILYHITVRFSFHFSFVGDAKDLFHPVMITKKLWPHDLIWDVVKMLRKSCITNQCATKKKLHSSLIRICFIFIISFYGDGSRITAYLAEILRLSKN